MKEVLSGVVVDGVHCERGRDAHLSLIRGRGQRGRRWESHDRRHLSTADARFCHSGVD